MTPEVFDGFLLGVIGVCGAGSLLNLVMIRKRGVNAVLMALAFLLFGLAVTLYRMKVSMVLVALVGASVGAALVADFVLRAAKPGSSR